MLPMPETISVDHRLMLITFPELEHPLRKINIAGNILSRSSYQMMTGWFHLFKNVRLTSVAHMESER
jgi:hypothetical protein